MEKVSGRVFNTATLPKFLDATEMAQKLKQSHKVPVTANYLTELAISGRCPAFFFEAALTHPLFIHKDVIDWMREQAFYQPRQIPTIEVVINTKVSDPHPTSLPTVLAQTDGLLEYIQYEDPCVYFLIDTNVVVYVGQSLTIAARVKQHVDKKFDRVLFLRVPKSQLLKVEKEFIMSLKPVYNKETTKFKSP